MFLGLRLSSFTFLHARLWQAASLGNKCPCATYSVDKSYARFTTNPLRSLQCKSPVLSLMKFQQNVKNWNKWEQNGYWSIISQVIQRTSIVTQRTSRRNTQEHCVTPLQETTTEALCSQSLCNYVTQWKPLKSLTLETSEVSAILVFTTKTTQSGPQVFSVNGALTCRRLHFWRHFLVNHKILPNLVISNWLWWIMRVLLANQMGEIFWMNNKNNFAIAGTAMGAGAV